MYILASLRLVWGQDRHIHQDMHKLATPQMGQ